MVLDANPRSAVSHAPLCSTFFLKFSLNTLRKKGIFYGIGSQMCKIFINSKEICMYAVCCLNCNNLDYL